MKLTLMIEGSASAIAAVLATLPEGAGVDLSVHGGKGLVVHPVMPEVAAAAPTLPGAPIPLAMPIASVTVPVPAPVAPDEDDGPADPNAPEVDSAGLPWDERIHAKTKKLNGDDTWKKRRNGPSGAPLAAIEAELRARGMVPVAAPVPVAPPIAPPPVAAPVPAPAPAPIAPAPVADPTDIMAFMQQLQEQMKNTDANGAPLITPDYLAALCQRVTAATEGKSVLTAITDLSAHPHLIGYVVNVMRDVDHTWK